MHRTLIALAGALALTIALAAPALADDHGGRGAPAGQCPLGNPQDQWFAGDFQQRLAGQTA